MVRTRIVHRRRPSDRTAGRIGADDGSFQPEDAGDGNDRGGGDAASSLAAIAGARLRSRAKNRCSTGRGPSASSPCRWRRSRCAVPSRTTRPWRPLAHRTGAGRRGEFVPHVDGDDALTALTLDHHFGYWWRGRSEAGSKFWSSPAVQQIHLPPPPLRQSASGRRNQRSSQGEEAGSELWQFQYDDLSYGRIGLGASGGKDWRRLSVPRICDRRGRPGRRAVTLPPSDRWLAGRRGAETEPGSLAQEPREEEDRRRQGRYPDEAVRVEGGMERHIAG
ncbi:hypothetical protein THAOC_34951 [Thalassiosira oceanica]|uniref:Uncharacterized protein n=1 Tax=Thalassiosira oceanica TaxID=159749 RepID=K0RIC1_THAOC|nr:hypothetical protein THAOC_34951 [Thalassiosira oceanica]|eukprot:EJK46382.1 hypothetical protein THAOC_34951 [Thalassiosira oceanica]